MAIKAFAAADVGNVNATVYEVTGAPTLITRVADPNFRTGLGAWRVAADSTYIGLRQTSGADSSGANFNPVLSPAYIGIELRVVALPTGNCWIGELRTTTALIGCWGLNASGQIILGDAARNVVATGSRVLSTGAGDWFYIELGITPAATGVATVKIDGFAEIDYSAGGSPFGTSGCATTRVGRPNADANGGSFDIANIIVGDAEIGPYRTIRCPLIGNGTYASDPFTSSVSSPNFWEDLDELPSSLALTDYMLTDGTAGSKRTFTIQDLEAIAGVGAIESILHAEPRAFVLRDGALDGSIKVFLKSGASEESSGAIAITSNRTIIRWPRVSPPGGGSWTVAKAQAYELGILEQSANKSRIHTLDVHFLVRLKRYHYGAEPRNRIHGLY